MGKDFTFITNEKDKKLKKRIIELIANSKELKFLVGFFYFSGIRELYQGLKSRPEIKLKVLVGLEVDKFAPGVLEYAQRYDSSDEKKEITQHICLNKKCGKVVPDVELLCTAECYKEWKQTEEGAE